MKISSLKNWARCNSLWYYPVGAEVAETLENWNIDLGLSLTKYPGQADLLIVGGILTYKIALEVKDIYEKMPSPSWVIALGDEVVSGGLYEGSYSVCGIEKILPVDIFIPGLPPHQMDFCHGIKLLKQKIILGSN